LTEYTVRTAAEGFVQLPAGQYTVKELEDIVAAMKRQNARAKEMVQQLAGVAQKHKEK
jgi:glutamate-1-semialdehyde aminotransferase